MTVSLGTSASTKCAWLDAAPTPTVPSPTLASTTVAWIRAKEVQLAVPVPSARLSTTGHSVLVQPDSSPTPQPMWDVFDNRPAALPMPNVQTGKSAMDNSARLFASMIRPAQLTNNVMMEYANLFVAGMWTVIVKKFAKELLALWDADQARTVQTVSLASTTNVLIPAVPQQPHVVPMPFAVFPTTRLNAVARPDSLEIQLNSAHIPFRSANLAGSALRILSVKMDSVPPSVHHLLTTASSMKSVSAVSANLSVIAMPTATLAMFAKRGSVLLVVKWTVSVLKVKPV